jgi:molybdopterin molybdotransferase
VIGPDRRLPLDDALAAVRARALRPPAERVPVERAAGRRLAEAVVMPVDVPAFTNSAMDGWAVRAADAPGRLALVGEAAAGRPWAGSLGPGQAARISTGAPLPDGADAVVPREDAAEEDGRLILTEPVAPGRHVRRQGEDLAAGAEVLAPGAVLMPAEVAVVAAAGLARVAVEARPRVALLTTGEELVEPGASLGPGAVVDSNRYGLWAQAEAAGAEVVAAARVRDDPEATRRALAGLLDGDPHPDLLVTSGGVSVGRHDHLRPALGALGVDEVFWGVAIRPGRQAWLGVRGAQRVLGVPGNPVSAALTFHVLGRPLLGRDEPWDESLPLARVAARRPGLADLVRGRREEGCFAPLPHQASHALSSLVGATHLAWIPAGTGELAAGTPVPVSRLG